MPSANDKRNASGLGYWTLGKKLALVMAVGVALGYGTVIAIQGASESQRLRHHASAANTEVTALLAAQIGGGIRFKKTDAIEEAYARLVEPGKKSVGQIWTLTKDRETVTRFEVEGLKDPLAAPPKDLVETALATGEIAQLATPDYEIVAAPVQFGAKKETAGVIVVRWSFAALNDEIGANILRQAITALVLGAVLVSMLIFVTWRMIAKPIHATERGMRALAAGDLGIEITGLDRRDEIGDGERLDEVGHGTGVAGPLHQVTLAEGGQHDHGGDALGRDDGGRRDAVELGHLDVGDDQIGPMLTGEFDGLFPVGGLRHRVAEPGQEARHQLALGGLVVDDQDPEGLSHARPPAPAEDRPAAG